MSPEGIPVNLIYLLAGVLFIVGLKDMTHPRTAVRGNLLASLGMLLAVVVTLVAYEILDWYVLITGLIVGSGIGMVLALSVEMTEMPQLVGLFNGFGGGASAVVAGAALVDEIWRLQETMNKFVTPEMVGYDMTIATVASGLIGAVTFWGSMVAAGKLHGWISDRPVRFPGDHAVKIVLLLAGLGFGVGLILDPAWINAYWFLLVAASLLGIFLVIPIGGADMPVVIALLNSYSGLAAAATGFVIGNVVLIIAGTLVGAAGMILTVIMCEAMNRSMANVFFGGLGEAPEGPEEDIYEGKIKRTSADEVDMLLDTADRVVIAPGYGMAVAQAQHAVKELGELLQEDGKTVEYAIHPVAGRMPGHMNVLLADADVPYDQLFELSEMNPQFSDVDLVITIGANDVVNPVANTDDSSPISGMPVLHVWEASQVVVIKRSLSPGFSGIPNPLFAKDNCMMLFGDGKEMFQELVTVYQETR
jgi:NAD(P) transhydrogenase subunit beta